MTPFITRAQTRPARSARPAQCAARLAPGAGEATAALRDSVALVLGGGRGTRLGALTDLHAKPAMSIGAMFRIVDFTLANCVNSGLRRVAVLTQYRAQSLIRHLHDTWALNRRLGEFIDAVPAQQRAGDCWYQGTADAVFQNLDMIAALAPGHVFVLGGDHVYKMDYARLLADHLDSGAEATVACIDVAREDASAYGVVQADADGRVTAFVEKPARAPPMAGAPDRSLVSMGIYVFDTPTLLREVAADAADPASRHDFGRDILPRLLLQGRPVQAHDFGRSCVRRDGAPAYWRDVGTLDGYWRASMDLAWNDGAFDLLDRDWPVPASAIATGTPASPLPSRCAADAGCRTTVLEQSLLGCGCVFGAATIRRSVISSGVRVGHGALIHESVVLPGAEVGAGVRLRRTIVEGHCRLPDGLVAGFDPTHDGARFLVTARGITLLDRAALERAPPTGH